MRKLKIPKAKKQPETCQLSQPGIYPPEFSQITAATVGKLAIQMYKNNEFTEAEKLVPLYIQDFIPNNL